MDWDDVWHNFHLQKVSTDILLRPSWLRYTAEELVTVAELLLDAASSGQKVLMPEAMFQNLSGILDWASSLSSKETETKPPTSGPATTTDMIQGKRNSDLTEFEQSLRELPHANASTNKTRKPAKHARTGAKSKARSHYVSDLEFPKVKYKVQRYRKNPIPQS